MRSIAFFTIEPRELPSLAGAALELAGPYCYAAIEDDQGGARLSLAVDTGDREGAWETARRLYAACRAHAGLEPHAPEAVIAPA